MMRFSTGLRQFSMVDSDIADVAVGVNVPD
jgi:hypothetical protein